MAQVGQQQRAPTQPAQQYPVMPDGTRFQPSPSRTGPVAYTAQAMGLPQYTGSSARPMYPQQNITYPPPQISNHTSPQIANRPPPPPPPPQMVNYPSGQMMDRPPPPPPPQMMNRPPPPPPSQMMNRPPQPPPSQMSNRMPPPPPPHQMSARMPLPPSQMSNRMPLPPSQMLNYPPPQNSSYPQSQAPSRRPSQLPQAPVQPGNHSGPNNFRQDPVTGAMINTPNNNPGNYEHSQVISPASNRLTSGDQQLPPSVSNNISPVQQQPHNDLLSSKFNERDVSSSIRTVSDDDALSMVSMNKKHLPVFARFPFDISFLSQPMNTNVDDSIQDLRHRLIQSELNHQRRTTDEYIKRTHRIGMETDPEAKLDLDRELEIQKIQASLNSGRRSRPPLSSSDYSYEPRAHLEPLSDILEERHFTSSNMDDLIDSMARRHLADRGYDGSPDRRRSGVGNYSPYFQASPIGRRVPLRSQQRNDDIYFANTTPTNFFEHDFTRTSPNGVNPLRRSGGDLHHSPQLDDDDSGTNNFTRSDSSPRLPPIAHGTDTNHFNRSQFASNSTLYFAKHNLQGYRNYQQSIPLGLPDHSEHLIELPSDIFMTSRKERFNSPRRHRSLRKTKPRKSRRHRSSDSEESETEPSDDENDLFADHHRRHRSKNRQEEQGFFTERNPVPRQKKKSNKPHRKLFRKAIIAVLFIKVLKNRATKNRSKRSKQTLSATIHKIRLQEIMVALHRVYLEPEGPIYNALVQATVSTVELKNALNTSSKYYSQAIHVIGDAVKNIISRIVDFMPKDGVLGTSKNSAIAALIQDGNPFPENYFWQCERELLQFNKTRLVNITKQRAILLIIGSFIFRALITTLLIKPIKYRLLLGQLTPNQSASLKVLASVLFYVGRRVVKSTPQILPLPHEWSLSLYNDANIKPIIQHTEMKPIIAKCEQSLRVWCEQYIRRIDASFSKELRA